MKQLRLLALVLALGLLLGACTDSTPSAKDKTSPSPSISASTPVPPAPPPIAPLTGLRTTAAILKRPALAIKIDNHSDARPQVNLDRADIVYEEPVEGGITRFIAVFHSRDADKIGPVRSARLTDLDVLAQFNRPLLAFSGAATYVLRAVRVAVRNKLIISMPHGAFGGLYRRDNSRWVAPHNLFTSTGGLWRAARSRRPGPAPKLFTFGALVPPPPLPVAASSATPSPTPIPRAFPAGRRVIVPFGGAYTADWRYAGRYRKYLRWTGGRSHRLVGGRQISASNVVIMIVRTSSKNRAAARKGTPQLGLVGSGPVVLYRNGVRVTGRWSRANLRSPTRFTDGFGRPMIFAPGNTWFELVPTRIHPRYL
ncbi:MAG: DUF3048 domain-containing protein [Actinomycetota bacterium]